MNPYYDDLKIIIFRHIKNLNLCHVIRGGHRPTDFCLHQGSSDPFYKNPEK